MKYYYDLHIHSNLSPCGDKDMTPNNIVNMAYIKNLDIISVTDHNSCKNFPAVKKLCNKKNITVIPGLEVNSKEEVHLLCYFKDYKNCSEFSDIIYQSLPKIKNKSKIFGEQLIYNDKDEIIEKENILLTGASKYSINEIINLVKKYKGIVVPSHVNRRANGIIGVLGFIPEKLDFKYIEISDIVNTKSLKNLQKNYKILKNSDAHKLEDISERNNYLEIESVDELFY